MKKYNYFISYAVYLNTKDSAPIITNVVAQYSSEIIGFANIEELEDGLAKEFQSCALDTAQSKNTKVNKCKIINFQLLSVEDLTTTEN